MPDIQFAEKLIVGFFADIFFIKTYFNKSHKSVHLFWDILYMFAHSLSQSLQIYSESNIHHPALHGSLHTVVTPVRHRMLMCW